MSLRFAAIARILAPAAVTAAACAARESATVAAAPDGGSPPTVVAEGALTGTLYEPARQFVQRYCWGCHGKDGQDPQQKGAYPAFRVDTYEDWATSRTILLAVLDKWNPDGDVMPPPDADEPSDDDRRTMLDWIRRNSPNSADGK
jgi:mono/diheme cytochrome c family protein